MVYLWYTYKMTMHKKQKRLLIFSAGLVLIFVVLSFIFRGWIRGSVVPSYVSAAYKDGVATAFKDNFTPIDTQLKMLGITFNVQDPSSSCSDPSFQGFSEVVSCNSGRGNKPTNFSTSFVSNWKHLSPAFETYIETHGWQKQWNAKQPITNIFDNPNNDVSVGVNYTKTDGKTSCALSIFYNAYASNLESVWAKEDCMRDVAFFGGQRL